MTKSVVLRASASPVDPISSATRWTCFGLVVFLFTCAVGSGEGAIFVAMCSAVLVGLYGRILYQIGRFKKPLSLFTLEDVEDPAAHAEALTTIERYNRFFRALLSWGFRLLGVLYVTAGFLAPTGHGGMPILVGTVFYLIGARVGNKSAIRLLAQSEDTPHVLYLRPFDVDDAGESATRKGRWWRPKVFLRAREEPVLSDMFALHGPVVAVGRPEEPIPQLGAARMYLKHDDWKEQVHSLINDASVVLLRIGESPGFLWEVEQVLQAKQPEQVLFYVSPSLDVGQTQQRYAVFREKTEHLFPKPLPESIGTYRFLSFESDWSPTIFGEVPTLRPTRSFFIPGFLKILLYHNKLQRFLGVAIRPFFAMLGYEVREKGVFSSLVIAIATYAGGPLTGGILMAKNLFAVGQAKRATGVVIIAAVLALLMVVGANLIGYSEWQARMTPAQLFLAADPTGAANFLVAFVFYHLWKRFCGDRLQVHLRTGGCRVSAWITAVIIIVSLFAWNEVILFQIPQVEPRW